MTDAEFDAFLEGAIADYNDKQTHLRAGSLAGAARWGFDPATGVLQFFDADDRAAAEADVIEVGRYTPGASRWIWGWSDPVLAGSAREQALPLRQLSVETGLELFVRRGTFTIADEDMAWHLTALAVRKLDALGAYRAPADDGHVFLAIMAVRRV